MSLPQPPSLEATAKETNQYRKTLYNVAIGTLVICPVLALLPPRKLDTYTVILVGTTAFSINYIHREKFGTTIWQRFVSDSPADTRPNDGLPTDRAREFQRQLREQNQGKLRQAGKTMEQEQGKPGILEQTWMGNETEGWKERREKEVQAALAEGKGYGDIIMDQIYEVWHWKKRSDDEE